MNLLFKTHANIVTVHNHCIGISKGIYEIKNLEIKRLDPQMFGQAFPLCCCPILPIPDRSTQQTIPDTDLFDRIDTHKHILEEANRILTDSLAIMNFL